MIASISSWLVKLRRAAEMPLAFIKMRTCIVNQDVVIGAANPKRDSALLGQVKRGF
jgi:hypothetical protein